jgi:hypothetical protein
MKMKNTNSCFILMQTALLLAVFDDYILLLGLVLLVELILA